MHQVSPTRVADQIVERLAQMGVTRVFGVPGGASSGLDHALYLSPNIEHVVCQHEAMAGYMAIGYHLATGLPGVVTVTSGPGVLNIAPALASAKADEVGLLVLAGDVTSANANRGALQDGGWSGLDTVHAMRPLAGLVLAADHPEQAMVRLEQCLNRCRAMPRGPAFLQLPVDVQNATLRPALLGSSWPEAGPAHVDAIPELVDALASAERPCLFVGIGVKRSRASAEVLALAEHLGCPVICDAEAIGVLPRSHALFAGTYGVGDTGAARQFLADRETDLIAFIGARLDDTTTNGFSADLAAPTVVQIDYDNRRIGRSFLPRIAVCADIRTTLKTLRERLPRAPDETRARAAARVERIRFETARNIGSLDAAPFDPRAIVARLSRENPDATFVSDIGNHLLACLGTLEVSSPDRFHFSLGLGGMGSGLGMAMGLSAGGRPRVIGIAGDGGTLMFGNDVFTCVKYRVPLVLVVFRDGELGMVRHGIRNIYGSTDAYSLAGFDVVAWARALGAESFSLTHPDELERISRHAGPGPLVVDVPIDPRVAYQNPREGIVAFPENLDARET